MAIADADADADATAAPPPSIVPRFEGIELCVRRSDNCQSSTKRQMRSGSAVAKPNAKLARTARQSDWQAIVCADSPAPVASLPGALASSSDPFGSVSAAVVQGEVVASSASGSGQASIAPHAVPQPEVSNCEEAVGRTLLEGVQVFHEAHGIVDMLGSYRRLMVTCPHHTGSKPCRKKRNFGVRSAAIALGDAEPYAFLGAWLRAHADFQSASEHCRYAPSAAAVRAYAREVGIAAPGCGPAD